MNGNVSSRALAAGALLLLVGSAHPAFAQDRPQPIVEFVTGYAGFVDQLRTLGADVQRQREAAA